MAAVLFLKALTIEDAKAFMHQAFWFLVLMSVIGMLVKLKTIREIIREFNEARGPIWDLRQTINQLTDLKPVIQQVGEQMALLDAKIESARKQVAELQLQSVSGRTDDAELSPQSPLSPNLNGSASAMVDGNWEKLRDRWRRNTQRLEYIIEKIEDGRSRIAYDRISRTNYRLVIDKLEEATLITRAAANASRELVELSIPTDRKNRKVPDSVIGAVELLDRQLESEIVNISEVNAFEQNTLPKVVVSKQISATSEPKKQQPMAPEENGASKAALHL